MSRSCVPAIPCPAWKVLIPALQPRMRELSVWRTLWRGSSRSFKELGTKSSWTRIPSLGPRPPLGYLLTLKNGSPPPPSLFAESEVEDVSVEPDFSFAFGPSTKEMEPATPPPAPEIEALGIECQRLNSSGWSKIPFAEAQKEIQASGVFGRLKVNPEIERRPSAKDDILAKMDGTLGCITHGLLLQRNYLEESMKEVFAKFPAAAPALREHLSAKDSPFRKTTDSLLQFVCGKRSDTILQRRKEVEAATRVHPRLLKDIPPSEGFLIDSKLLTEALKNHASSSRVQRVASGSRSGLRIPAAASRAAPSSASRKRPAQWTAPPHQPLEGGQLSKFVTRWKELGAPEGVINVLRGYAIPFASRPPILPLRNPSGAIRQTPISAQVDLQVQKLLEHRVLVPNPFVSGFTSPLFLVPKGDGSKRPIINLKRLNQFLSLKKFHLINHFRVPDFLQRGDFLVKIDLSQAYFHVPIRPSHQRFLSLVYRDTLYCMTCLPLGLASAPQVFAKLTNWIANYLRNLGMRVIVYLDDFLLVNQDSVLLRSQARAAVATLQSLGWSVNLEKSVLWPVQTCQYLGIMWNPTLDSKSLPLEKQSTIQRYLLTLLQTRQWSWRIAKVLIGYLSFAAFVIPLGKLHFRRIQWSSRHLPKTRSLHLSRIPPQALTQIQWWSAALHRSSPIFPQAPQVFVSTDASNSGWGAIVDNHSLGGVWWDHQEMWHINLKEMFAVRSALERKLPVLQDKVVLIQSDNQTVVSYIHKEGGTKSFKLLREVEALFDLAVRHNITLMARYIPGKFNTWADSLSRQKELPDWHLLPEVTQHIFAQWGVPEIDLFATANSAVVPRFAALSTLDHQAITGLVHPSDASLGERILVAGPESKNIGPSPGHNKSQEEPDRPSHKASSSRIRLSEIAGFPGSGWTSEVSGWDQSDLDLLRSSWRESTLNTFKAPWKRWLAWTSSSGVSVNNPAPKDLARFLSYLHSLNFSYSSILVHKSVVANFANPSRTQELTGHPVVRQILKAISLKRAIGLPEKREIWDVSTLISWISDHPPNQDSFFEVARHTAILLLLCSGRRVHDLTLLLSSRDGFQDLGDRAVFWPAFGSKTDTSGHRQSGWQLKQNPSNPLFDPLFWVRKLISLSSARIGKKDVKSLFITTRGEVKAASRSIIAGWIKTAFSAAGINASAGSFRSAVGSSRMNSEFSLDVILSKGNWKGPTNFLKHYYKPVAKRPPDRSGPLKSLDLCFDPVN
ncbi:hypothetical protein M8J77_003708 [Diaphorina citri]|nr:hypothetical protein M8J77_003708 [Diaphorina citri]